METIRPFPNVSESNSPVLFSEVFWLKEWVYLWTPLLHEKDKRR